MATQTIVPPARTIGEELGRCRLEHRARQVEVALAALRKLADGREGGVPEPLGQAIAEFSQELADVNCRLAAL